MYVYGKAESRGQILWCIAVAAMLGGPCIGRDRAHAEESDPLAARPASGEGIVQDGPKDSRVPQSARAPEVLFHYDVRLMSEKIYAEPRFTARPIAAVRRGDRLAILEARTVGARRWLLAAVKEGETGWIQQMTWRRTAGETARELDDRVALSGPALTVKSLRERLERLAAAVAEREKDVERAVDVVEAAHLDRDEIDGFRRDGGLRSPGEDAR